jgi:C4-dicarboxylate-specific signal transduction histidine kinase
MAVMAASVANEFNDELTLLVNELAASLRLLGREHPARLSLVAAQHAALRCTAITADLLEFTRRNGASRPLPLERLLAMRRAPCD